MFSASAGNGVETATRTPGGASHRVALAFWLGAWAGAVGGVADCVNATLVPHASARVRIELAIGCMMVCVLASALLAAGLGLVWELTESLGNRLRLAWPFRAVRGAQNLPIVTVLAVLFANDSRTLFSGPGISRTGLTVVLRWAFPVVGSLVGVGLLRAGAAILARLRSYPQEGRILCLFGCMGLAALLLRVVQLHELDPYVPLRRYGELGALLSAVAGLALFETHTAEPRELRDLTTVLAHPQGRSSVLGQLQQRLRIRQNGARMLPLAICLTLPFLFPSNDARLALASGKFIAAPEVYALRHLVDLDRDGYSPILGGGDCNDFDRRVHPFSHDVPGDGVDQACDGVDDGTAEVPVFGPAYGSPDAPTAQDLRARAQGKNILVILVDALRFDRLQDPRAARFPRLTRLSRQSASFARALAPSARTTLSIPAILDGTRREGPGVRLFHELHASGSHVGLVALDVVMDQLHLAQRLEGEVDLAAVSTEGDRTLWGGGVHVFTSRTITDRALGWLDGLGTARRAAGQAPWLLWVHYFSAHQWDEIEAIRSIREVAARYDAALADDDRGVGELLDGLAARGLSESTLVVLLTDHGESLGDHGWRTHGGYLYPELVHVPMSILVPGAPPVTVQTPVPTAALAPTLLDLVGVAHPRHDSLDSLVPLMAGGTSQGDGAPRPIVMQDTLQKAIAVDNRILRFTPHDNTTELFSLDELDASHSESLVAREPAVARRLSRLLAANLEP
jgi:hypothetical protein